VVSWYDHQPTKRQSRNPGLRPDKPGELMVEALLPHGFENLAPFLEEWVRPTTQARRERREAATMSELVAFYEPMLEAAPAAMRHLEAFPIDAMPDAEGRLYQLVLMLAHVSMATELHGAPRAPHTPYPHGVRLVKGPAHFG